MKSIIAARGWSKPERQNASDLIKVLIDNGLIPTHLLDHSNGVRKTLEGGLPTIANRNGRHGQGPEPVEAPDYIVAYAMHLAATNIVFLVQAHQAAD
jgi:hypothetical protein